MLDPQNEIFDRRLAFHLVSLYYKTKRLEEDEILVSFWDILLTEKWENVLEAFWLKSMYVYSVKQGEAKNCQTLQRPVETT